LNALMYSWATCVVGVQPHQVTLADVADPALPDVEPPPQAARKIARKLSMERAGMTRRLRLMVGDMRMVPPGPVLKC
jgi:hypothetical protein